MMAAFISALQQHEETNHFNWIFVGFPFICHAIGLATMQRTWRARETAIVSGATQSGRVIWLVV